MLRSTLAAAALLFTAAAIAQTLAVPAELWDRPRTAGTVLEQDSVKRTVTVALERPDAQIVIHHAAGQEPALQAEELRSWLGALAIDTRRVVLRSDATPGTPMTLEISP